MHHHPQSRRPIPPGTVLLQGLGLLAIALVTFYVVSTLIFTVLGLAPSSPEWLFVPVLGGILAIAGAAVGLQTFPLPPTLHRLAGIVSGAMGGTILGFYSIGEWSGQELPWATGGAIGGGLALAGLATWAYGPRGPRFWRMAIALISSLCAYGAAFGLGAWALAALTTQRWALGIPLGLLAGLSLWWTRRALGWVYRQWLPGTGIKVICKTDRRNGTW